MILIEQKKIVQIVDCLMNNACLINNDCLKVLPTIPNKSIDLIFTDPPYTNNLKYYTDLLSTLRKKLSISNGSLLILEHPENINLKEQEDVIETRKYGSCFFSFLNL